MSDYSLKLVKPAFLELEALIGDSKVGPVKIDVYEAHRMLSDAEKKPSEEQRWKQVRDWMVLKLGIPTSTDIGENNARLFHETIVQIVKKEHEAIVFQAGKIACSQQPSQVSPIPSLNGMGS